MSATPIPGREDFDQQRRTFALELLRAVPNGVVETAATTFAVFIAIQVFGLPSMMKAGIVSSGSVGLLLSLFIVQILRRLGIPVNRMAAAVWSVAALGFALAAMSRSNGWLYFGGICLAFIALGLAVPLMSQIYRKHYPDLLRGRLFSYAALARACVAAASGVLLGGWVRGNLEAFGLLFWTYAGGCLAMAACVLAMAPVVLRPSTRLRWFDAFGHVARDAPFRKLLVVWMLLGLGNLVGWALFVEFIGNPRYGHGLDAGQTGFVTSTVPMLAFIVCVAPWGWIFDRLPFYRVRALVNAFFLAGILIYYLGSGFTGLCVGIALHGIARSGGNILWSLWVTRFTDAERVVEYMSVHSFLTGVRGVLAPLIAFTAAEHLGPSWVAGLAAVLIVVSTLMILPEILAEGRDGGRGSDD